MTRWKRSMSGIAGRMIDLLTPAHGADTTDREYGLFLNTVLLLYCKT